MQAGLFPLRQLQRRNWSRYSVGTRQLLLHPAPRWGSIGRARKEHRSRAELDIAQVNLLRGLGLEISKASLLPKRLTAVRVSRLPRRTCCYSFLPRESAEPCRYPPASWRQSDQQRAI